MHARKVKFGIQNDDDMLYHKIGRSIPVAGIPSGNYCLGNTPNFGKVGNTGKYEILELFELKYAAIFP